MLPPRWVGGSLCLRGQVQGCPGYHRVGHALAFRLSKVRLAAAVAEWSLLSLLKGREDEVTLFLCRGHGGESTRMVARIMRAEDFARVRSATVGFLYLRDDHRLSGVDGACIDLLWRPLHLVVLEIKSGNREQSPRSWL